MSRIAGLKPKFQIKRGNRNGVVYEDGAGWHTELSHDRLFEESAEMNAALSQAKQALSQYVNRRGEDPPRGATIGVLALWLMQKIDGTAMGRKFGS